jgi:hypothetical protein
MMEEVDEQKLTNIKKCKVIFFFMIFFLGSKVILISTLNDKYKTIKSKIQQIKRGSDSLTRLLGGSWNLLSLTWKKC